MKVIIVFTLFLLSFNFGSGVDPIVREDDYATDREDSLASNDQDVNLLDKYDQGKYFSNVKAGFKTVPQ